MTATNLRTVLGLVAMVVMPLAYAGDSAGPQVTPPAELFTEASPALRAHGFKNGIRLDGWAPLRAGPPRPGDAIVVVASCFNGGLQKQWLVQIEVAPVTLEQSAQKGEGMTLHTSTGRTFQFGFSWIALKLLTIGPVAPTDRHARDPDVQHALIRLNGDYLSLGINHATDLYALQSAADEKIKYRFSQTPFDEKTVAADRVSAERIGLTEATERAFTGTVPALLEFFEIVQHTPGVRDILFQVLEKPSALSMLKGVMKRSIEVGFGYTSEGTGIVENSNRALAGEEVRAVPMTLTLSTHPALQLTLFATEPQPPLRACAGIVGLKATQPKHSDRFVILRVVASTAGPEN